MYEVSKRRRLSNKRRLSNRSRKQIAAAIYSVDTLERRLLLSAFQTVASFVGTDGGVNPDTKLVMDAQGNLYGEASTGGTSGDGVVYEIARGTSALTNFALFNGTDGNNPDGGLFIDTHGNLFGTTDSGGTSGDGTVFEILAGSHTITTIASFHGTDGSHADGGVVMDASGDLFGTTSAGTGTETTGGSLFEIAAGSSTITTLAGISSIGGNFTSEGPIAGLVIDGKGDLFGTFGSGVYELAKGSSTVQLLKSYGGFGVPGGDLVMDSHGNIFGDTEFGGAPPGDGTLFEIAAGATTVTELVSFPSTGTFNPMGQLAVDGSGDLFGAGLGNTGVFELVHGSSTITTLASYSGPGQGSDPQGGLIIDSNGNLFGTTAFGGAAGDGVAYELASGSTTVTTLASFSLGGASDPLSNVVVDQNGNAFGATNAGGASGLGTIYEVAAGSGVVTTLASFDGTDGSRPEDTLLLDKSGDLFGTTFSGGSGNGTIFELQSGSSTITTLVSFDGAEGGDPGPLVMDQNGDLFVAVAGDADNLGGIYELASGSSSLTTLAPFTSETTNGAHANSLYLDASGDLFGTSSGGGTGGFGAVFELAKGASAISVLASFDGTDGAAPSGGLVADSHGNLYGATDDGGVGFNGSSTSGDGTVFEIHAGTNSIDTLYDFTNAADGGHPVTIESPDVAVDSSGNVYGTAEDVNGMIGGVVWEVPAGGGSESTLETFTGANGESPISGIVMDPHGNLWGTTGAGGVANLGTVFEVQTAPAPTATHLVFVQQPTTVTAGVAISPSVTVEVADSDGDIVSTDNSTITLSIDTGPGSLGGTVSEQASGGIATFDNLLLTKAGQVTLDAEDGKLAGAQSDSFTVNPAGASQLVFTKQPGSSTAGSVIQPGPVAVSVEDQFNNLVTIDTSTVILALDTGTGTLGGTTSLAASGGVVTFTNLSVSPEGQFSLKATDGILAPAVSDSFSVAAAPATQLALVQQPTTGTVGTALSPNFVVNVEDQFADLISSDSSSASISILTGPSGATLSGTTTQSASGGVVTFSGLSVDKSGNYTFKVTDGKLASVTTQNVSVSASTASKLVFTTEPTGGAAGAVLPSFAVTIEDSLGNVETGDNSMVTLSVDTGASLLGGTISVAASGGVATFNNVTLSPAGAISLKASDNGLQTISNSFNITPGAASQLVIVQQPTSGTVGTAMTPNLVVNVEDNFGDVIAGDFSNVSLAILSGPSGAVLSGTTTQAASAGVATFSGLGLNKVGGYTIQVTDGKLAAATTQTISINASAASKLVFTTEPGSGTAGTTLPSFAVSVEDSSGDVITTDSSTVSLTINSGTGALAGTTSVGASSGVVTFNNVSVSPAGSFTLKATDGNLSAVSTSFTIAPAAASKLVMLQQPTSGTAGTALTPSFVVDVEDAFGDVIAGDFSNVSLAIFSGPSGATLGGTTTQAASAGVATLGGITLDKAGAYTIQATDGKLAAATSTTINISAQATTPQPPDAVNDSASTPVNTAVTINELANDTDPNAGGSIDPTTVAIVTGPTNGTASVNPTTGSITYTPTSGYTGGDTIVYDVKDNLGLTSNDATISITVTPANTDTRSFQLDGWQISYNSDDLVSQDNGQGLAISESSVALSTGPTVITFTQMAYNASPIISIVSETFTNITGAPLTGFSKQIDNISPGNAADATFTSMFAVGGVQDTVFGSETMTAENAIVDGGSLDFLQTEILGIGPTAGHIEIAANPAASGAMKTFELIQTPTTSSQAAPTILLNPVVAAPSVAPAASAPIAAAPAALAPVAAAVLSQTPPVVSSPAVSAPVVSAVLTQDAPAVVTQAAPAAAALVTVPAPVQAAPAIAVQPVTVTTITPTISTQVTPVVQTTGIAAAADRVSSQSDSDSAALVSDAVSSLLD
jgi:uncharacterized repeat protein (TIGR03803 family)